MRNDKKFRCLNQQSTVKQNDSDNAKGAELLTRNCACYTELLKKNESPTKSYFAFMCSHWHKEEIILLDFLLLYTLRYFQVLALSTTFLFKPEEDAVKPAVYNGHPREIAR